MNFDDFESGGEGAFGRLREGINDIFYFASREFMRRGVALVEWDCACGNGLPTAVESEQRFSTEPWSRRAAFAARVRELNTSGGAFGADKLYDRAPRFDVGIEIEACVRRRYSPARFDGGRFRDDERRSADGSTPEMNEMPCLWMAVDGRVFAHWRDDDAVSKCDFPETDGSE